MVQKYIDKIVMSEDNKKMKELEEVLVNMIDYIQRTDTNTYCQIENDLYEIAEGKVLTLEKVSDWVNRMKPKAKWSIEEAQQLKDKFKTEMPLPAFYGIINMLYSDLGDVIGEDMNDDVLNKYVQAAEDWYYDEDSAKKENEKLYYYVKCIIL